MSDDERAFLAGIAAHPDADLPRLVFADWLDENGQPERAEYIRRAIAFDPHRDRFDDPALNEERRALEQFEEAERQTWNLDFLPESVRKARWDGIGYVFRRGLIDAIELPVQWWIEHGHRFRDLFPALRKVVIFRLNGWGERLAACETLRGIQELTLACWYSDADARAVANSPNVADVERLVLLAPEPVAQSLHFARSSMMPKLADLHLLTAMTSHPEWVALANEAASRPIASLYDFDKELFPFAPDFYGGPELHGFFVGKLPDGALLFTRGAGDESFMQGWLFNPDGTRREPFRYEYPAAFATAPVAPPGQWSQEHRDAERRFMVERAAHFTEATGFTPAFIRVEEFQVDGASNWSGPTRYRWRFDDDWQHDDDPLTSPENDRDRADGHGGAAYRYIQDGEYGFWDSCWCDRSGQVTST